MGFTACPTRRDCEGAKQGNAKREFGRASRVCLQLDIPLGVGSPAFPIGDKARESLLDVAGDPGSVRRPVSPDMEGALDEMAASGSGSLTSV
mmetsp:Transcript_3434/g.5717  ORF Transcript_3434/g.5717 Transcript_3434/m.5717 type:complete len:92 (-) Transcript_3434:215-490(-)